MTGESRVVTVSKTDRSCAAMEQTDEQVLKCVQNDLLFSNSMTQGPLALFILWFPAPPGNSCLPHPLVDMALSEKSNFP